MQSRSMILVADADEEFRKSMAQSLQAAGHDVVEAVDGVEALAVIAKQCPDAVVIDLLLPRKNGLQVLKHVRGHEPMSHLPVVVVTSLADRRAVVAAAQCGVQGYLLKSRFDIRGLVATLKRHASPDVAAALPKADSSSRPARPAPRRSAPAANSAEPIVVRPLMTFDQCIARAETAMQEKTLSGVVMQVVAEAASPRSDLQQLTSLIVRDPVLSARVLRAANSALYRSNRGSVSTIPEAVRNIGSGAVRNIAAALGIFEAMPDSVATNFNPFRCWQHSFAVAQLCERLAMMKDPSLAGTAYMVGLCHDLGEILFHTTFADEYKRVLEMQQRTGRNRDDLEREMLGISHNDLIVRVLHCIGLPDTIREPIESFYRTRNGAMAGCSMMTRILHLANLYANGMLLASSPTARIAPLTAAECRGATGEPHPAVPDTERFRGEIMAITAALPGLSAKEEADLLTPLYRRTQTRVWLARDIAFSAFDPLAAALQSLADVVIDKRLPSEKEAAEVDRLVIASRTAGSFNATDVERVMAQMNDGEQAILWLCNDPADSAPSIPMRRPPAQLDQLALFVRPLQQPSEHASPKAEQTEVALCP